MGRIVYTVDPAARALRTQKRLPTDDPVNPLVSDVVNLKAQYGLDTDNDGIIDALAGRDRRCLVRRESAEPAAGDAAQIRAVRVAIVTRSAQYEKDPPSRQGPLSDARRRRSR